MSTTPDLPPSPLDLLVAPAPPTGHPGIAPILYHYTDQHALHGIATNGKLWATKARYLNDNSEIMVAFELAADVCRRQVGEADAALRAELERFITYVEQVGNVSPSIFIVSLSEDGDTLSQWRAYGSYALGLDWTLLNALENWQLAKCIYDREAQEQVINAAVERAIAEVQAGHWTDMAPGEELSQAIGLQVRMVAPAIKHPAFYEEREWRLFNPATVPQPKSHIRAGARTVVEYAETELPLGALREVVVGPGPYGDVAQEGASALMYASPHTSECSISHSRIPYLP